MAAPRKRTARKTTTSRSRTPAKSGRSSASFVAMGIIAGLAIAILFYTILIRQDANLAKDSGSQYVHTPNQPHLLNPLPPRPSDDSSSPPVAPPKVVETRPIEPQPSIAESTAQIGTQTPTTQAPTTAATPPPPQEAPKPSTTPPKATEPRVTQQTPSTTTAPAKQPTPKITEDAIGNLIAQNEKAAQNQPRPQSTSKQDNPDHVGALLKTMPAASVDTKVKNTSNTAKAPVEKKLTLSSVPSLQKPFYLQAGPYKAETEADAMRAQLLLLGHSTATVHKSLVNNQTVYRVRTGPYTTSAELNKAQKSMGDSKLKLSPIQ